MPQLMSPTGAQGAESGTAAVPAEPVATAAAATAPPRIEVERAGADCYIVLEAAVPIGFVDVVGRVFVALHGPHYAHAVEVGQTKELDSAARLIVDAAHP